jgi:hypothetical protein
MADLSHKVKNSLDEARHMILVVQVLLGFQFRAPFEPGFVALSRSAKGWEAAGLGMLLAAFVCFVALAPFIELAFDAETSTEIASFATVMLTAGLLPFVGALAINCYVATATVVARPAAATFAAGFASAALWWWYVRGWRDREPMAARRHVTHKTSLVDRIQHVLTEARMIVPGAQALLGFQFTTFFTSAFERLPDALKYLHIASLGLVALATVFLIAPAAYHRVAENGEDSERVAEFGSRMVVVSLIPLGFGIALDVIVVVEQSGLGRTVATAMASALIASALTLWAFYPMWRRARRTRG